MRILTFYFTSANIGMTLKNQKYQGGNEHGFRFRRSGNDNSR